MAFNSNMESQRLFGAADLLLKAIELKDGKNSLVGIYSDVPRPRAADPTGRYTLMELIDAMTMLIRMGFVTVEQCIGRAVRDSAHRGHRLNHAAKKRRTKSNDESRRPRSSAGRQCVRNQAIRRNGFVIATMN